MSSKRSIRRDLPAFVEGHEPEMGLVNLVLEQMPYHPTVFVSYSTIREYLGIEPRPVVAMLNLFGVKLGDLAKVLNRLGAFCIRMQAVTDKGIEFGIVPETDMVGKQRAASLITRAFMRVYRHSGIWTQR